MRAPLVVGRDGTGGGVQMAVRAELYCYFCGHGCGEVLTPAAMRRPTPKPLRTAYAPVPEGVAPAWEGRRARLPFERGDHLAHQLVELDPHVARASQHRLPVHRSSECLVLHLLPHRGRVDIGDALRGTHERDGRDEAGELVDGVEGLLHERDPGKAEMVAVRLDGVHDVTGDACLFEDGPPALRMCRRVALGIEVVQDPGDGPGLFFLAVLAGEVAHRGLDRERVPAQAL